MHKDLGNIRRSPSRLLRADPKFGNRIEQKMKFERT